MHITTLAKSTLVIAMGVTAYLSLSILEDLVGDLLGAIWILSAFFLPFLLGISLGQIARRSRGVATGAVAGLLVPLVPIALLLTVTETFNHPDGLLDGPLLTLLLAPLAMVMGALTLPMGASARAYRRHEHQGSD